MKALVLVALAGAATCLSSCSTGARSLESLGRTGDTAMRSAENLDDAAVRSTATAYRTSQTAVRSYDTYQLARSNAPATIARSQGTLNRLFDSIFRSFQ